jgi:hypothetical protein
MNRLVILLGIAIAVAGQSAIAKSHLTDPVRIARDCKGDLSLLRRTAPGSQRMKNCLREKMAELSPSCLSALKATE